MSYTPSPMSVAGRASGRGRAMGDVSVSTTLDPAAALAAQVNRFGPAAPAAYRFADHAFTASGAVPSDLAMVALLIYQRRATEAYNQFHDAGSAAAIASANRGFADPVGFITSNLSEVTSTIGTFADSLGIAAAPAPTVGSPSDAPDIGSVLLIAGGLLALWMVLQ